MYDLSHSAILPDILVGLFAASGILHIAAPTLLRRLYRDAKYPRLYYMVAGGLQMLAAVWLADPGLRLWGAALGAVLMFFIVVTLLSHRRYVPALTAMVVMASLMPAAAGALAG